jgi:tetratricopeptide (TPR) repeat protein
MFSPSKASVQKTGGGMGNRSVSLWVGLGMFAWSGTGVALASWSARDYTSVQSATERKVETIRNEEIKAVRTALGLRNPENRKAELYLRLAELYQEAYRSDFLMEGRLQERELKRNPQAKFVKSRSVDDLKFSIGAAEAILALAIDGRKLDQVYFFLGYNYGELGNKKKSLEFYRKLAKQFPDSFFASEAVRFIADEAFQRADYAEAQTNFEIALRRAKDKGQTARILHKLAWCHYRQKRGPQALETMKRGIEIAKSEGGDRLLSVRDEGLRDLAIYFSELGRADEAIEYFKDNAGSKDKLVRLLERLGREYERKGEVDSALKVYEVLLNTDQRDESEFRVSAKMIELDIMKARHERALDRMKRIELLEGKEPETQIALLNLRNLVRTTAVTYQERFRKTKEADEAKRFLQIADRYYTAYLDKFLPADSGSRGIRNEIRMYQAEVKSGLGRPGEAATLYQSVIQDQDSKYSKIAAGYWMNSLHAELKRREEAGERKGSSPSRIERDFISASDLVEKHLSGSPESLEARLRSVQVLKFYAGERKEALKRADSIVSQAPSAPQAVVAARIVIELDPTRENLERFRSNQTLLQEDGVTGGKLGQDLDQLSRTLLVGQIKVHEQAREHVSAAKAYEEFIWISKGKLTRTELDGAYQGAFNSYARGARVEDAVRMVGDWAKVVPGSKLMASAVPQQAGDLLIRGYFKEAARLFRESGRLSRHRPSLELASDLYRGIDQIIPAREALKEAMALCKNDEERAETHVRSAMLYRDEKNETGGLGDWKACAKLVTSHQAQCQTMIGALLRGKGDLKGARKAYLDASRISKGPSAGSAYVANALYELAVIAEQEIKLTRLELPLKRLIGTVEKRSKEIRRIREPYQKALEAGGPWGIAAAERMGDVILDFSRELSALQASPSADAQTKELLNQMISRLNRDSFEISKSAYDVALKNSQISKALPVIQDRLVDSGQTRWKRSQGSRSGFKLIGMLPEGDSSGKEASMKRVREQLMSSSSNSKAWVDYGNLLWGIGRPGLAKIAYEQALLHQPAHADALSNMAVVQIMELKVETWSAAILAINAWKKAIEKQPDHLASHFNLGLIFNYYRLFPEGERYFLKAVEKSPKLAEAREGLAVAYFGQGKDSEAADEAKKAVSYGLKPQSFSKRFREVLQSDPKDCKTLADELGRGSELSGFELISVNLLKARCSS